MYLIFNRPVTIVAEHAHRLFWRSKKKRSKVVLPLYAFAMRLLVCPGPLISSTFSTGIRTHAHVYIVRICDTHRRAITSEKCLISGLIGAGHKTKTKENKMTK